MTSLPSIASPVPDPPPCTLVSIYCMMRRALELYDEGLEEGAGALMLGADEDLERLLGTLTVDQVKRELFDRLYRAEEVCRAVQQSPPKKRAPAVRAALTAWEELAG